MPQDLKSLPKAWETIEVNKAKIETKFNKSDVIDNLTTADPKKSLSSNQGVVLWEAIKTLSNGGSFETLTRLARANGKNTFTGNLPTNTRVISVGDKLHNPEVFLDGDRISEAYFTVVLETGTITLNEAWSDDYDVTWVVLDTLPYHIKFSYPTLQLLQGTSESFKNSIEIDDVIEILGQNSANDGDHRLVVCQATQGTNGVELSTGKWLNEIPNTRNSGKANLSGANFTGDIVAPVIYANRYLFLKDYFGREGQPNCDFWYNAIKDESSHYGNRTLYIRNVNNIETSNSVLLGSVGLVKNNNGYIKLSNGILIQWGQFETSGVGGITISLPTAFTVNNYSIQTTWNCGVSYYNYAIEVWNKQNASCSIGSGNTKPRGWVHWFAIGY